MQVSFFSQSGEISLSAFCHCCHRTCWPLCLLHHPHFYFSSPTPSPPRLSVFVLVLQVVLFPSCPLGFTQPSPAPAVSHHLSSVFNSSQATQLPCGLHVLVFVHWLPAFTPTCFFFSSFFSWFVWLELLIILSFAWLYLNVLCLPVPFCFTSGEVCNVVCLCPCVCIWLHITLPVTGAQLMPQSTSSVLPTLFPEKAVISC